MVVEQADRRHQTGAVALQRGQADVEGVGEVARLDDEIEMPLARQELGAGARLPHAAAAPDEPGMATGVGGVDDALERTIAVEDDHAGVVEADQLVQLLGQELVPASDVAAQILVEGQVFCEIAELAHDVHRLGHGDEHGLDRGR